ncbi:MAG: Dam family site-specific DNA-(adenine-N6)-methyltransferase [Leptospirales bacterium]
MILQAEKPKKSDITSPKLIAVKPFLKWAGGKSQLLSRLEQFIPEKYNKYIEPFVGGGALFFRMQPERAVLADSNEELIITYKQIQKNLPKILMALQNFKNEEEFYYTTRAVDPSKLSLIERAARLLYLNKTCYNGLYRVNKKGQFNVPYGKTSGNFSNREVLNNARKVLHGVKIEHGPYDKTLAKHAEPGDFIFLDPPYYPVGPSSDFKRYTKDFFYEKDHVLLKNEFDRLVDLGCKVVLTNSSHPFIVDLYKKYEMQIVATKRLISCNAQTRSGKDIIVIGEK